MIEIKNLSVELDKRTIFENVSFSIGNGVVAILGLNGCGKTTLLKTIVGLIKPQNGEIKVDNKNIFTLSRKEIGKKIAYLPQEYPTYFSFTVKEMILMGRTPHIDNFKFPSKHDFEVAQNSAKEIGITHLQNKYFTHLSGGEKKLVLISMILAQETEYIILDEPTSFLDLHNSMIIIDKINKLAKYHNKKIIISMHDINQTLLCADNVLLLNGHEIPRFGNTYNLITKDNLSDLYKMDFEIINDKNKIKYVIPSTYYDNIKTTN
ncbi:MAG: ABC transporter ATP-binding protein [Bacteroidia bacterium]|nr:ABC transporter ATP-binding protein [Candidatus Vicinibacter affinis]MCC6720557.1 ABC transporter ATP-binding protein [Bacteroidia bacterium]